MRRLAFFALLVACSGKEPTRQPTTGSGSGSDQPAGVSLDTLKEGQPVLGWKPTAVYLDDHGAAMGARFVHGTSGFTLDYLRIESAPQGFIWVTSVPTSDKGEPHTQEHLLLGKGDRGRKLGSTEAMALAHSSAFTDRWHTAYHFHTVAGNDVFWPVFENELDALLHPDYTDEEIRREVRNFGVDKADNGTLRLEEKGTVYNEMVRTYEAPDTVLWRAAGQMVYGEKHPLAMESGGYPAAIRDMTPADIRAFHASAYHLGNMGMVAAFPRAMALDAVLQHTSDILGKMANKPAKVTAEADLPKPAPATAGTTQVVSYPYSNTSNPGPMMLAWPATRALDDSERLLLGLFLDAFAGDESTTLYKLLIDSKTRTLDIGANALYTQVSTDQGQPVYLELSGVKAANLDAATIEKVRALVTGELTRIAGLPDGDKELAALNQRVASRVVDLRRKLVKFLDSPPGFGFRGIGPEWFDHLRQLVKASGFGKSLTLRPALTQIEKVLAGEPNPWKKRLAAWGLDAAPFGLAAKPSPELRKQLDDERTKRINDELARLGTQYSTKTPAETLAKFKTDSDAETEKIEAAAKAAALPPLVDSPPMTLDDGLAYKTDPVKGLPALRATFDTMASARVGVAFKLDGLKPEQYMYLALLPQLMSQAGVIEDGKPIAAAEVRERLRKEILALNVRYTESLATGRVELVVEGAGNDVAETQRAIGWMGRVMYTPDWRVENLPRLRDQVDQALVALRQTMLGAEEAWVGDPRDAWWKQTWPLHAHTNVFLTQAHDIHRLRWMLQDPQDPKVTAEVTGWLGKLAAAGAQPRAKLAAMVGAVDTLDKKTPLAAAAGALSAPAQAIAKTAAKDLGLLLADLPDATLAADWAYLCKQMAHDLGVGAPKALAELDAVRKAIVRAGNARVYEVGSGQSMQAIAGDVDALVGKLDTAAVTATAATGPRYIADRLLARDPTAKTPRYVGLVAPGTSSGVFENTAPAPSYAATSDEQLLDYLASNLYTGHGAHSLFMKTWAAGLAYSNGVHPFVDTGAIEWYAERCPLLPQTLRFVIGELEKAKADPNIARYALAQAFSSRLANSYEGRAAAMAADLANGLTPDKVKAFRAHLLVLAKKPDLADVLFGRLPAVYGPVLPGYGKPGGADQSAPRPSGRGAETPDDQAFSFVIGPEKQLAAYEGYLTATVGKDAKLYRLYPRDYWVPAAL